MEECYVLMALLVHWRARVLIWGSDGLLACSYPDMGETRSDAKRMSPPLSIGPDGPDGGMSMMSKVCGLWRMASAWAYGNCTPPPSAFASMAGGST